MTGRFQVGGPFRLAWNWPNSRRQLSSPSCLPQPNFVFSISTQPQLETNMGITKMLGKAFSAIIFVSGAWLGCVLACTRVWLQRQYAVHRRAITCANPFRIFYAHRVPIWWGQKLNKPETFGFLSLSFPIARFGSPSFEE